VRYASLFLCATLAPGLLQGQTRGSLGLGVGTVRYLGGSSFSSASISPAIEFASPTFAANVAGTIASLPHGVWSLQGRSDVWVASPALFGDLRVAVQGIGSGVSRTDSGWSSAAHGIGEVLWSAHDWGLALGAGPSAGWIAHVPSVTAFHARGRVWWRSGPATWALTVEPTHFLDAWFTDVGTGVTFDAASVTVSVWGGGRLSSVYGSKGAAGVAVQTFPLPSLAIELGAGSYLPEPYQGLPRAAYGTVGIRLFTSGRRRSVQSTAPVWPPLTPLRRGDSVVVRVRMDGATSVALAGSWDGWQEHRLRALGQNIWEGALVLRAGTYHFILKVDDKEWVVPNGVALVTDRNGGMVGVLLVR
jgi:hypothetical protein